MSKRIVIFGWADSVHIQRWVRGLSSRGFDMKLISLDGKPLDDIETVILPRSMKLSYITQAGKAGSVAKSFKPDLVHAHYASGFGLWAKLCNIKPSIVSVWGADIIDFPSNPANRFLIKKILNDATYITATSNLLKDHAIKLAKDVKDRLTVIPFGVKIPAERTNPPTGRIKICFIKAHRKKYGPDILLQAISKVKEKIPDIQLTLAGEGDLTSALKLAVLDYDIQDNVQFVGHIENKEIYSLIKQHHFMVMPSVMESESFGVAVLEANACGRPVIASRIGGVPEVIRDGETGLLVPPENVGKLAEAIIKLATNRDLCNSMGKAAYDFVKENYDWESSLDSMAELYERLIYEQKTK